MAQGKRWCHFQAPLGQLLINEVRSTTLRTPAYVFFPWIISNGKKKQADEGKEHVNASNVIAFH